MKKQKYYAFGKHVYLLGTIDGKYQWLEEPSWDCNWYWGFGYVEEYTSHKYPEKSRDINGHTHISTIVKDIGMHKLDEAFDETTFDEKEKWQLAELFKQFYLLNEMAQFTHREPCGTNITTVDVDHGNLTQWSEHINNVLIPNVTKRIIEILDPETQPELED